jgi:hypothetical protein
MMMANHGFIPTKCKMWLDSIWVDWILRFVYGNGLGCGCSGYKGPGQGIAKPSPDTFGNVPAPGGITL